MIRSLDRAVIDEIQRTPRLLLAIKKMDEDQRPGRFPPTGSASSSGVAHGCRLTPLAGWKQQHVAAAAVVAK